MGSADTLNDLVRQYLDLWQKQWSAAAAEPKLASAFTGLAEALADAMKGEPSAAASAGPTGQSEGGDNRQSEGKDGRPATGQAGTAAAAPASRPGASDVDELLGRFAVVERRLAALETNGRIDGRRATAATSGWRRRALRRRAGTRRPSA